MQAGRLNALIIQRHPGVDWAPTLDLDGYGAVVIAGDLAACGNKMSRESINTVLGGLFPRDRDFGRFYDNVFAVSPTLRSIDHGNNTITQYGMDKAMIYSGHNVVINKNCLVKYMRCTVPCVVNALPSEGSQTVANTTMIVSVSLSAGRYFLPSRGS